MAYMSPIALLALFPTLPISQRVADQLAQDRPIDRVLIDAEDFIACADVAEAEVQRYHRRNPA